MNNKKNVVFLVAVSSGHDYLKEKHGDFKYFEFSINSWKYWCEKNDVELFIYDKPSNDEHVKHKPTWQRWFDIFDQLESNNINYNKILVVDASTIGYSSGLFTISSTSGGNASLRIEGDLTVTGSVTASGDDGILESTSTHIYAINTSKSLSR